MVRSASVPSARSSTESGQATARSSRSVAIDLLGLSNVILNLTGLCAAVGAVLVAWRHQDSVPPPRSSRSDVHVDGPDAAGANASEARCGCLIDGHLAVGEISGPSEDMLRRSCTAHLAVPAGAAVAGYDH